MIHQKVDTEGFSCDVGLANVDELIQFTADLEEIDSNAVKALYVKSVEAGKIKSVRTDILVEL